MLARKFLDWSAPALPAVADYLIEEFSILGIPDLSGAVVVVPGRRAGRRLMELLVQRVGQARQFRPPRIETLGNLPELLYEPKRPFAPRLVQVLAWGHALRQTDRERVREVIRELPDDEKLDRWLDLGQLLWRVHRELAAEALDFQDVIALGQELADFGEEQRWQVLRQVQQRYLAILDELDLWDRQTARLFAIKHEECHTDRSIILVGTVDMNVAMRQMLEQVADSVTVLIHAPQSLQRKFDEFGCLVPDAWQDARVELDDDQVRIVDGPFDQADAVVRALAGFEGTYRPDEITIGLGDAGLVPILQRQLCKFDVRTRYLVGRTMPESGPYRLLAAVGDYLSHDRFEQFAALARHPAIQQWVGRHGVSDAWLVQLDQYHMQHLPPRLGARPASTDREAGGGRTGEWLGKPEERDLLEQASHLIDGLLEPLRGELLPLAEWTPVLVRLLLDIYGDVEFDQDDPVDHLDVKALELLHEVLVGHTAIPARLSPTAGASQAIRLLLQQLSSSAVPPLEDDEAVEMLGWLELPLDDAPALVVTGFNEGYVPQSVNADLFLPNRLRRHLGVVDNVRRYARDAYALSVLQASRRSLTLIASRRDQRGDPLVPSRLLFATKPRDAAARVVRFFGEHPVPRPLVPPTELPAQGATEEGVAAAERLVIPRPRPLSEPIRELHVTAFRSYLACPYRFYLRHVLRLEEQSDDRRELDAAAFGNLMHDCLHAFGASDVAASTDSDQILACLESQLERSARDLYGHRRLAAVNVQIEQLKVRLAAFAEWQAQRARDGWRIVAVERRLRARPPFLQFEQAAMGITGRIDRIDVHESRGLVQVLDYKSGDTARRPETVHRKRKQGWVDLQLPLYRHLVKELHLEGDLQLGFITLPKDTLRVDARIAAWSEQDLVEADQRARWVAGQVLNEVFWPPTEPPPRLFREFASLCQEGAFDRADISIGSGQTRTDEKQGTEVVA